MIGLVKEILLNAAKSKSHWKQDDTAGMGGSIFRWFSNEERVLRYKRQKENAILVFKVKEPNAPGAIYLITKYLELYCTFLKDILKFSFPVPILLSLPRNRDYLEM